MKSESVVIEPSNGSPLAQKNHTIGQTHSRCDEQDVVTGEGKKVCFKRNCFQRVSGGIVWCLETLFYKLGYTVACHPFKTIFIAILVCGAMGIGLLKWREEILYVELWLPRGSRMYDEYFWVQKNFPASARYESVIIEDENILSSDTINAMMDIYLRSTLFKTGDGNTLDNLCVRSGSNCRVNSLLELWSYNESIIRNLTSSDILDAVNAEHLVSPLYQSEMHADTILGGIRRNETGKIIGAGATTMLWLLERNKTIEESAKDWELQLLDYINDEGHRDIQNIYIYAQRTWEDEGMGAVTNDAGLLTVGFSIVLVYVTFTIGNYSMIHHKILLAFCGLSSTAFAFLFTLGLGFVTGIMYGVIHQILPFMLLDILCQWSETKNASVTPKLLEDITIKEGTPVSKPSVSHYAPQVAPRLSQEEDYQRVLKLLFDVRNANSKSAMPPVVNIVDLNRFRPNPIPPVSSCEILPDKCQEFDIPYSYQLDVTTLPLPIPKLATSVFSSVDDDGYEQEKNRFLSSLHFSETDRLRIEDITKGQSDNAEWYEQRKGCITGSKVNRIVSFVENGRAKADTIVGEVMMYDLNKDLSKSIPALAWGKKH